MVKTRSRHLVGSIPVKDISADGLKAALVGHSFLFSREVGSKRGFDHWQFVVKTKNPTSGATVERSLPLSAHVEPWFGSLTKATAYVLKGGPEAKEYYGTDDLLEAAGVAKKGKRMVNKEKIKEAVLSGRRYDDIVFTMMEESDGLEGFARRFIARQDKLNYGGLKKRPLKVHYIYGDDPEAIKDTIESSFPEKELYLVKDRSAPWQEYENEKAILFYCSFEQFDLMELFRLLGGGATPLPNGFEGRWAAYDKVFFVSPRPFSQLFRTERLDSPELYRSWLSRFTSAEKVKDGVVEPDVAFAEEVARVDIPVRFREGASFADSLQ